MSYHTIDISGDGVTLSAKRGQLTCTSEESGLKRIPLEDVGAILVNSRSCLVHNELLMSAAEHKVAMVFCRCFKPVSVLLPVTRGGDTLLTRAQVEAPRKLLNQLWLALLRAKLLNQYSLLEEVAVPDEMTERFRLMLSNPVPAREAICARHYWAVLSKALGVDDFRRERGASGFNSLLNYGYAVLLSQVLQALLSYGLDPQYGIHHATRERAAPLAYDLMEPFRAAFDETAFRWAEARLRADERLVVSPAYKAQAIGTLDALVPCGSKRIRLRHLISRTAGSFRDALLLGKVSEFKPWLRRTSRWDG